MRYRISTACFLLLAAATSQAAGAYWGANLGFATLDCAKCEVDPNIGGKALIGIDVVPYYVAVEGGYAYLSGHGDAEDRKQQSAYLAGVLSYPLSKHYLLSLKVGGSYNRAELKTASGKRTKGEWADDLYYGAGVSLWVDRHVSARLEYERFSKDDGRDLLDADLFSLGFVYRF